MAITTQNKSFHKKWLISSKLDCFILFFLTPFLSILLVGMAASGVPEIVGIFIVGVIVDLPHQVQTHLLLLSNPDEFTKYKSHYFGSLIVIFGLCCFFSFAGMIEIPVSIWAYWIIYHVIMQHFGLAAVYARRNGYSHSTTTLKFIILFGCIAPIALRMATTGLTFGTPIQGIEIITPRISIIIPYLLYFLTVIFLLHNFYVQFIVRRWKIPMISNYIMIYALAQYNLFFFFEKDLLIFLIFSTLIHAIQYHLIAGSKTLNFVQNYQNNSSSKLTKGQKFVAFIVSNPIVWSVFVILVSLLVFLGNPISYGVIPLTWAMHHFYLDGVIWKRKRLNWISKKLFVKQTLQ